MKEHRNVLVAVLAACLLLAAMPSHALVMPKVDVCHFDADAGVYRKASVSGNALQPHLGHGDLLPGVDNGLLNLSLDEDCFAIALPDPIARAYIDVDGDHAYDGTKDVDIAVLLDTDDTPWLSEGDTLVLRQYSKEFNPCPDQVTCPDLGNFLDLSDNGLGVDNFTVREVLSFNSDFIRAVFEILPGHPLNFFFSFGKSTNLEYFFIGNGLIGYPECNLPTLDLTDSFAPPPDPEPDTELATDSFYSSGKGDGKGGGDPEPEDPVCPHEYGDYDDLVIIADNNIVTSYLPAPIELYQAAYSDDPHVDVIIYEQDVPESVSP